MNKASAIYSFWAGFGLPAFEENSIFELETKPQFPYITYEMQTADFDSGPISLSASLWYRSHSWVGANTKADEIAEFIGRGGVLCRCDGGIIHIKKGTPFAQNTGDDSDYMIKRVILTIDVKFLTVN